jgi:c-di-GMP-binding flagellar brake protein YcgR
MTESPDGIEKRQDQRSSLRVPIYIAAADGVVRKTIRLESRDVSAGGLSFETGHDLALEAESQILFSALGDGSGSFLIRGRVVWTRPLPATGRYVIGIQFTEFEGISREELLARMEQAAKSSGAGPRN